MLTPPVPFGFEPPLPLRGGLPFVGVSSAFALTTAWNSRGAPSLAWTFRRSVPPFSTSSASSSAASFANVAASVTSRPATATTTYCSARPRS